MKNTIIIQNRLFKSQKEAEGFFYDNLKRLQDNNLTLKIDHASFLFFKELYLKYCEATAYPISGAIIEFGAKQIQREAGTTIGCYVKFDNDQIEEFSLRKAISSVANSQKNNN